jgi:sugar transferase (PEP-CTERM system associated)
MTRFFRVHVPSTSLALLIADTLLVTSAFVLATFLALAVDPETYLLYDGGYLRLLPVLFSVLAGMHFCDLYSKIQVQSRLALLQQLCLVMGAAFLVQGVLSYLSPALRVPVRVMVFGSALAMAFLFLWRVAFSTFALQVMGRDTLLLVGGSALLIDIARHIERHPELALEVTGYVTDSREPGTPLPGGTVLGPISSLTEVVQTTRPNRLVIGMSERRHRMPVAELLDLRFAGHIIEEAATTFERVSGRVRIRDLRPSQLIYSGELGPRRPTLIVQAFYNRLLSAIGLVLASPIMLLTALAVWISSPGPILYRQQRVGLDGEVFTLYKFRSMRVNAEAETGAIWASRDDPRITRVGKVIRKLRFDELPQLVNGLIGNMSIVGPRPERPEFVRSLSEKIPYYRQRHAVRPGITGWAQINYKYGDTLEDAISKLEYDLYYIKNMSFRLDMYIIFHTVKAMLLSRGAQ